MDRAEFVAVLSPLVVAMRAPMDGPTWQAYHRALQDIPSRWLAAAVDAALRQDRSFLPKPGELRALANHALRDAHGSIPLMECADCHNTRWVEAPDTKGVIRATRCGCWHAYRDAVAALGQVEPPVALLEAGREDLSRSMR